MARLKEYYRSEVLPALKKKFGYRNTMEVPRLEKIVLNMGLGEAIQNVKILDSATAELTMISGQKPVVTKAKKSIATYKLRKGMSIGCMVTLRRDRMYEFFDRFVNVAIPRIRDFRGISPRSFDGRGNFSTGVNEHYIFPETDLDKIEKVLGLNITIVTSAQTDDEARELLRLMGLAFRN